MKNLRCSFQIIGSYDYGVRDALVIRDMCVGMSLTNDAEAVVWNLRDQLTPLTRLFYYDSEGSLDELQHDGKGGFIGYAPGPPDHGFLNHPRKRS